ncbi:MAG: FAD-dependent oxidoreductase [Caldilineaceae bacterium]
MSQYWTKDVASAGGWPRAIGPELGRLRCAIFHRAAGTLRRQVERWQADGLVYIWGTGWSDGSLVTTPDDGHPRYAIHGGMNALARTVAGQLVANGVTILTERCVTKVTQAGAGWRVSDETGALYTASALVLTPPVPQSLALLDAGDVALASADRAALEAVTYAPCLCALFWLEGKITLPAPGALQRPGTDISWIADNQAKGLSPMPR